MSRDFMHSYPDEKQKRKQIKAKAGIKPKNLQAFVQWYTPRLLRHVGITLGLVGPLQSG